MQAFPVDLEWSIGGFVEVSGQPSYVGDDKFILNFYQLPEGSNLGLGNCNLMGDKDIH